MEKTIKFYEQLKRDKGFAKWFPFFFIFHEKDLLSTAGVELGGEAWASVQGKFLKNPLALIKKKIV